MDELEFEKQLKADFLNEAEEIIQNLELRLLGLESADDQTASLNDLFRNAHTLKGSGMVAGFVLFASFAHKMENLLDILRSSNASVEREDVDILLLSLDKLKEINQALKVDYDAVIAVADLESTILRRIETLSQTKMSEKGDSKTSENSGDILLADGKDQGQNDKKADNLRDNFNHLIDAVDQTGRAQSIYIGDGDSNFCALIKLALGASQSISIFSEKECLQDAMQKECPSIAIVGATWAHTILENIGAEGNRIRFSSLRLIVYGDKKLEPEIKNRKTDIEYMFLTTPFGKKKLIQALSRQLENAKNHQIGEQASA